MQCQNNLEHSKYPYDGRYTTEEVHGKITLLYMSKFHSSFIVHTGRRERGLYSILIALRKCDHMVHSLSQ